MAEVLLQIHKYQAKYMMKLFLVTFCWCELIATSVALQLINIVIHTAFTVRMNIYYSSLNECAFAIE